MFVEDKAQHIILLSLGWYERIETLGTYRVRTITEILQS
jgi:hypothetical protein